MSASVGTGTVTAISDTEVVQTKAVTAVPSVSTATSPTPIGASGTLTAAALLGVGLMKWSGSFIGGISGVVGTLATLAAFGRWYHARSISKREAVALAEDCVSIDLKPHATTFCTGDGATDERINGLTDRAAKKAQDKERLPPPVLVSGRDVEKELVGAKIAQQLGVAIVTVDCTALVASGRVTGDFTKVLERKVSRLAKDHSREGSRHLTGCVLVLADLDHLMVRDPKSAGLLMDACNRIDSSLRKSALLVITSGEERSSTVRDLMNGPLEVTVHEPKKVEDVACLLSHALPSAGLDQDTSELFANVFGENLKLHSVRRDVAEALSKRTLPRMSANDRALEAILEVCFGQKLEGIPSPGSFELDAIVAATESLAARAMDLPVVGFGIQSRSSDAMVYRQRALESSLEGATTGAVMKELVLGWVRYLATAQYYGDRHDMMPLTSLDFKRDLRPHLERWASIQSSYAMNGEIEAQARIDAVVAKAQETAREMVSCFSKRGSVNSLLRSATPPSAARKPIELVGRDFNQTCEMFGEEIAAAAEVFTKFVQGSSRDDSGRS